MIEHQGESVAATRYYQARVTAAKGYAARGWIVIPVWGINGERCRCGDAECKLPGKHPLIKDWTETRPGFNISLHTQYPGSNLGILTGEKSGIFVVDVDGPDGEASLSSLVARNTALPETLMAKTGRGRHLYFQHPGRRVKPTAGVLGKKLDVRGDGGYVVAPPSMHVTGTACSWIDEAADIAEAPGWLIALVCGDVPVEQPPPEQAAEHVIDEGSRNQTLLTHACTMRAEGAARDEIERELLEINQHSCQPPLDTAEVKQIAASAARYQPGSSLSAAPITGDEKGLWWFPVDTLAWRQNQHILCMKDSQVGWYIWLIVECWNRGGYLPNDPEILAKLARASSLKRFRNGMAAVLAEFDVAADETTLVHAGLKAEYQARLGKVESKRQAARKRWENAARQH